MYAKLCDLEDKIQQGNAILPHFIKKLYTVFVFLFAHKKYTAVLYLNCFTSLKKKCHFRKMCVFFFTNQSLEAYILYKGNTVVVFLTCDQEVPGCSLIGVL